MLVRVADSDCWNYITLHCMRVHCTCLWLDVAMADACTVDVAEGSTHLVRVQLDEDVGHALIVLRVVLADSVDCVWHVLQHQVEVRLVLLCV